MEELDGQYAEVEGRGAVTFVRSYPVGAAELWAAVSTDEGLARWFPSRALVDPDAGTVSFSGDPNLAPSTEQIADWDPPRRWAFAWGPDLMEFLVEGSDVEAELTLRNWLGDNLAAARNAAGWHVCLGQLAASLGAAPVSEAADSGAGSKAAGRDAWERLYEGYAAAGVPTGAPIPSGPTAAGPSEADGPDGRMRS